MAARKKLSLNVDIPVDTILYSDRQILLQCIINLTGNAVKFTENGSIIIVVRETGGDIEIVVSHTGLGLYLPQKICAALLQGKVSLESRAVYLA